MSDTHESYAQRRLRLASNLVSTAQEYLQEVDDIISKAIRADRLNKELMETVERLTVENATLKEQVKELTDTLDKKVVELDGLKTGS